MPAITTCWYGRGTCCETTWRRETTSEIAYSHLLIDEAQDTDPIQAEIAMFIAEDASEDTPADQRPTRWDEVTPEPGKLFVVGDPKQSIYRFRRADVRQMETLRRRMGGSTLRLVQNFRSQRPVIDWVNQLFDQWMAIGEEQAEYTSDQEPMGS